MPWTTSRLAPKRLPIALLLAVTVVWGSTFVIVKTAVSEMAVMDFLSWRFAVASLAIIAVRPSSLWRLSPRSWLRGGAIGLVLGGAYIAQTFGLEHTTAAVSGFLTGMYVVFTPLLSGLLLRQPVSLAAWGGVLLSAGGLAVIALNHLGLGEGELLTLLCALCYGLQIIGLGEWSAGEDPVGLCAVQLLTATVCCVVAAAASCGLAPPPNGGVWAAVVVTAVLATALAFLIQTWAQARVNPLRVAVVLTMEPVFAGLAAAAAGEPVGWRVAVGGVMVVAAMYLVELTGAATGWSEREPSSQGS